MDRRGTTSRYYQLGFFFYFDKVPHQRLLLLHKLEAYGIGDGIIDWTDKRMTDKRHRAVVDEKVSKWKLVLSVVPQRSVLGPGMGQVRGKCT